MKPTQQKVTGVSLRGRNPAAPEVHNEVIARILAELKNERERQQPFEVPYQAFDILRSAQEKLDNLAENDERRPSLAEAIRLSTFGRQYCAMCYTSRERLRRNSSTPRRGHFSGHFLRRF